jgi:hypothetical protein
VNAFFVLMLLAIFHPELVEAADFAWDIQIDDFQSGVEIIDDLAFELARAHQSDVVIRAKQIHQLNRNGLGSAEAIELLDAPKEFFHRH